MQQLALFETMKRCSKCGELKPATSEYFRNPRRVCKACERESSRKYYEANRDKFREYYEVNRDKMRESSRKYYEVNRDKMREYREVNRDKILEYKREYYESNRDKILESNREYRGSNRDKVLESKREYYEANRDKFRLYSSRYRARKRDLPDTLTDVQVEQMLDYFDYKCAVCGQPQDLFIGLELDHWIPLSSEDCTGTIATNIVPLCGGSEFVSHIGCNPSKSDKDAMEWLTDKFGTRKAKQIMKRIDQYFEWVQVQ